MHGNVWEWRQDWYAVYDGDKIDPTGPATGGRRVLRGGAFTDLPLIVRSASRDDELPFYRNSNLGFRLARTYDLSLLNRFTP